MAKARPTRRPHRATGFGIALLVFLLDQAAKWAVVGPLALPYHPGQAIDVLPVFTLRFVENHGVSMGFLVAGSPLERWLLVGLTLLIAAFVALWLWRERKRADAFALALVLGGAFGNILDRVRLGYVVDFLDLHFGDWHPFLVFNVADAAITIGVLLLVLRAVLTRERHDPAENANA